MKLSFSLVSTPEQFQVNYHLASLIEVCDNAGLCVQFIQIEKPSQFNTGRIKVVASDDIDARDEQPAHDRIWDALERETKALKFMVAIDDE